MSSNVFVVEGYEIDIYRHKCYNDNMSETTHKPGAETSEPKTGIGDRLLDILSNDEQRQVAEARRSEALAFNAEAYVRGEIDFDTLDLEADMAGWARYRDERRAKQERKDLDRAVNGGLLRRAGRFLIRRSAQ